MIKRYKHKKTGEIVRAIKWDGTTLVEIIDMIGCHESVVGMPWKAYSELVEKEGLHIFRNSGCKIETSIGDYITLDEIEDLKEDVNAYPSDIFEQEFTVISEEGKKEVGHKVVTMEEIKRWIPLAKMENADAAEYKYRIEAAYHVQMEHEILTPIPYVGTKEIVLYEFPELVALCPVTFLVDVYKVDIRLIPGDTIPELKSLKYNFSDYIQLPISHEHLASRVYRDLKTQIDPDKLQIVLHTNVRGGITTTVTVGDEF